MIEILIGLLDGAIGVTILLKMAGQSFEFHCPQARRWALWIISMGFIHQAVRHLGNAPKIDSFWFAVVHGILWISLSILLWRMFISRRQEA